MTLRPPPPKVNRDIVWLAGTELGLWFFQAMRPQLDRLAAFPVRLKGSWEGPPSTLGTPAT